MKAFEINKLDNKYLVLKWDDIGQLNLDEKTGIHTAILKIQENRKKTGKNQFSEYIVLNLDDKIDHNYLIGKLNYLPIDGSTTVRKIAANLVNAILKIKE